MPQVIQLSNEAHLTPIALIDCDGLVVMFHASTSGTVIQSDGHIPIGYHSDSWEIARCQAAWKPFHGTVTINIK